MKVATVLVAGAWIASVSLYAQFCGRAGRAACCFNGSAGACVDTCLRVPGAE